MRAARWWRWHGHTRSHQLELLAAAAYVSHRHCGCWRVGTDEHFLVLIFVVPWRNGTIFVGFKLIEHPQLVPLKKDSLVSACGVNGDIGFGADGLSLIRWVSTNGCCNGRRCWWPVSSGFYVALNQRYHAGRLKLPRAISIYVTPRALVAAVLKFVLLVLTVSLHLQTFHALLLRFIVFYLHSAFPISVLSTATHANLWMASAAHINFGTKVPRA